MKRKLSHIAGIIGLAIGSIASNVFAQTTANGPYYATPSWDQTLPASTRFIVLSNMNNEAVLDRETGLVWQRSPGAGANWFIANARCVAAKTGNRAGWRLPTIHELASLFDTSLPTPPAALPPGHPFLGLNTSPGASFQEFWSSTQVLNQARHRKAGYATQLGTGIVNLGLDIISNDEDGFGLVWCVRGGLLSAPQ